MQHSYEDVYVCSWFLNITHPAWEALVVEKENQYEMIMPLLSIRRYGLDLHPSPILAQRLGIYGHYNQEIIDEVFSYLNKHFASIEYPFTKDLQLNFTVTEASNYILPLNKDYSKLADGYRKDRKQRVKQGLKHSLEITQNTDIEEFIVVYREEIAPKILGGVSEETFLSIKRLIEHCSKNKNGFLIAANIDGVALSQTFFIKHNKRLICFLSATNNDGKRMQAKSLIMDHVIRTYANTELTLDFKGSHIDSIADYFKSFGAEEEKYSIYRHESTLFKYLLAVRKFAKQIGL